MGTQRLVGSLLLVTAMGYATAADNDGRGQSIMFGDSPGDENKDLMTMPRKQSIGDRCMEMARQVEALKGKPQRRSVMAARYQQECEQR